MVHTDPKTQPSGRTPSAGLALRMVIPFLVLFCCLFQTANATHFRYGTVNWSRANSSTNTVTFSLNQVWRTSFGWGTTITPGAVVQPGTFSFGDGSSVTLSLTVTSVNVSEDWFSGTATITHTYPSAGSYTADFSNCCRLSNLQNNFDENFRTETQVVLNNSDNASPVSTLPPIVFLPPATVAATFQVPAIDPDGDPYTFSLSNSAQQGGAALTQPSGFSISSTGLATLNTVGKTVGQIYNASVRVTDSKGAATTVDFIMKIANQVSAPYFDYTDVPPPLTPLNNTTFYIQPGQTLTFNVTGRDNDLLDVVTVLSSSLPSGSVLAAQTGTNPAQRVFTWTPTINQLGTYILSFDLIDGQGTHAVSPTYVNIVVSTNPLFDVGPTPPNNSTACIKPGTKYFASIQAHSPDTALTVTITATSIPSNAHFSPNPTDPANITLGELNWAPTVANWGPNNMTFTATDALGNTATHTYNLTVNTPPVFTSTQGNTTITVGQLFTYVVSATDVDIPYGDQLEIHDVTLPSWLTYTDNGDGTYTLSGTPTAADLGAHQVHLEAEDIFHHCYAPTEQIFTITVIANPLVIDIQTISTCANTNNGAVSVAVTNGTAPYSYRWSSSGTGATDVSAQTGSSITGLAPGTYSVTITDDAGIQGTASATVTSTLSTFAVSPNVAICPGGSATLSASGADIYSWSTGETTADITVSPTTTTVYTVTGYVNSGNLVTNGDFSAGNTGFTSDYVYVNPTDNAATPLSGGTHTGLVPEGVYAVDGNAHDYHPAFDGLDHTTGSGSFFMITNGSGTPNTEVWSQTVNNILPNTTYYFSTWVTSVNPDSPAELNFSINGQPLGTTFFAPAGVTGTWVQFYQTWNSGSSTSADIAIVNQNVTLGGNDFGLDDISFTTVCPDTRTVTVTISPVPTVDAGPDQIICPGASATLHVSGTKGDRFLWSTGDTTQTVIVTPGTTTTYTVTLTNALDCAGSDEVTVTVGDTTAPTAICKNITVQLVGGTATVTGADIDNGSSDNCAGSPTLSASPATFSCTNVGPNTVTLTVTDAAGNSSTCQAIVTVEDGEAPTALCKNVTVQLDANGEATVSAEQVDNGSADGCGPVRLSVSPSTFSCFNVGPNQVTLTVYDNSGNSASCTATVTVEDTIAPNAVCQNITVQLDANGQATISASQLDSESGDVCGVASVTASDTSFDCSNIGDNRVTLTVTDNHGNSSTCTAVVTVEDHIAPTAVCQNATVQLDANGVASVTAAQIDNGSSDACGIASLSVSPSTFNCSNVGPNTVTLTVTDNNGNTSTCTATVTVQGLVAPAAVCQNVTVQLDANGEATITAAQIDNGSSSACGIASLSVSPSTFSCNNVGPNQVTLTVTDNNGNTATCTATVTVEDTTAPNAVCQNITVQLDANGQATITASQIDGESADVCGVAFVTASDTSFDCSNIGDNRVTLTVTDNHGNSSTCTAVVTVEDHVAPTAVCQNVTVQLDANGNASVTAAQIDNGSSDACGIASLSVSPSNFTCANVGANTVTLTVTDNNGNTSTCTATVTVAGTVTPTAICQNVTVYLDGNGQATVTAAQVDNGSSALCGVASISVSPSTFNCSNVGPNQVTLTVTDNNGNTATCTATVTVEDNTAPILGPCPADVTITALTNNCFNNHAWTKPLYSENCSGATLSVTASDPTVIIFDFGSTYFASFPVGTTTVTQTVTDAHGNSDDCSFTVTVVDRQNPIITGCPANITVNASATQCSGQAFWNQPTASDNCPGVSLTGSSVSGDVFPLGTTTVTYVATDAHGNSVNCSFTVTVRDASGPQAICKAATVDLNANGTASITAAQVDNGSFDNCSAVTLSVSPSTFTCANVGANNVTLTATDANGNTATCTAVVTVRDVTPPTAICKNITVALNQNGTVSVTAAQINNGSYDNCGVVTLSAPACNFTCANVGPNNVTLTVRDASGNTSTCTAVVTVTGGNTATTVSCKNITAALNANGVAEITAAQVSNGASGACGSPVTLSVTPNRFTCANLGANNVTLTATDANGNTATCTAVVTVTGGSSVTTVSCKNITVDLNAQGVAEITAAQVSNGASGPCGSPVTLSVTPNRFTCANRGANTVTLTATDGNGNTATCTATVTVRDVTPPTAICRNKTVALVNGTATITAAQINNGSYDNCAVTSVTVSKTTFNCGNIGANQVTLTVRDAAGNTSTCTATVTVTGQGLSCSIASVPTSSCAGTGGNPNNIYIGYGPQSTRLQVSVTGGGAPYTYSWSPSNRLSCSTCANPLFTPNAPGNYTFTVTVRNCNGCTTTCDITICVLDIRVPANNGCGYSSDKVYVCHIPPGNHNNPQTLSISVNAVSAHVPLHGGDRLGRCNQTCGNYKTDDEDGVAELVSTEEGGFEMILYPNPFRDQFRLKIETESKEPVDVRMFSITGQLMNEQKNVSFTEDLYFGYNLANGVYLVEVKQGDYSKVVRMTKAE